MKRVGEGVRRVRRVTNDFSIKSDALPSFWLHVLCVSSYAQGSIYREKIVIEEPFVPESRCDSPLPEVASAASATDSAVLLMFGVALSLLT